MPTKVKIELTDGTIIKAKSSVSYRELISRVNDEQILFADDHVISANRILRIVPLEAEYAS
jgi:hypothetical protein